VTASTFSICAFDPDADELGVAVQSKFLAVGAVVPWAMAGVGAFATQAWANTSYGPRGLQLLQGGHSPSDVVDILTSSDLAAEHRQLGVVDATGRSATYTGGRCLPWAGGLAGDGFAVQGNILAGEEVVAAMVRSFHESKGHLAERLLASLRAGEAAGGDRRGRQSAALLIVKPGGGYGGFNDRYVDLRVDDHPDPIRELARLVELHSLYFRKAEASELIAVDERLGAELCELLSATGDLPQTPGPRIFDDQARAALIRFMHRENLEERVRDDGRIDTATLAYMRRAARR